MIKNALTRAEGKKRKRRDSDEGKAKSKVNFTRPRCYSEEVDVEDEVEVADDKLGNMHMG